MVWATILLNPWVIFSILIIVATIIFLFSLMESGWKINLRRDANYKKQRNKEIFMFLDNQKMPPKEKLEAINQTARLFFDELFYFDGNLEYSKLHTQFKTINNTLGVKFCDKMIKALYTGNKVTSQQTNELITILKQIIQQQTRTAIKPPTKVEEFENKISNSIKETYQKVNHKTPTQKEEVIVIEEPQQQTKQKLPQKKQQDIYRQKAKDKIPQKEKSAFQPQKKSFLQKIKDVFKPKQIQPTTPKPKKAVYFNQPSSDTQLLHAHIQHAPPLVLDKEKLTLKLHQHGRIKRF